MCLAPPLLRNTLQELLARWVKAPRVQHSMFQPFYYLQPLLMCQRVDCTIDYRGRGIENGSYLELQPCLIEAMYLTLSKI